MTSVIPVPSIKHGSYKCHFGLKYSFDDKSSKLRLCNRFNKIIPGYVLLSISKNGIMLHNNIGNYDGYGKQFTLNKNHALCITGVDDII